MLLQPPVRFHDLVGIGRGCEDLRNQRVRIQCNRRYELLQLCRSLLRRLNRWCWFGLGSLIGERPRGSGYQKATGKKKGQTLFQEHINSPAAGRPRSPPVVSLISLPPQLQGAIPTPESLAV